MLQEVVVEQLHDSIVLQCVVGCELLLHALLPQEFGEHLPSVLASMIRSEVADSGSMLHPCPCHKCLVGYYGLVFGFEQLHPCVSGIIISECDIISLPTQAVEW
jgi:hypothetical protein